MANQSPPTHKFAGGITLQGNTYPSDAAANVTYGGIVPTVGLLLGNDATQTISATDGLVFFVTPSGATIIVLTLPTAGATMDGRIYTFYVGAGSGTVICKTDVSGTPTTVPGTVVTVTAKGATITVLYENGLVAGSTITSAT